MLIGLIRRRFGRAAHELIERGDVLIARNIVVSQKHTDFIGDITAIDIAQTVATVFALVIKRATPGLDPPVTRPQRDRMILLPYLMLGQANPDRFKACEKHVGAFQVPLYGAHAFRIEIRRYNTRSTATRRTSIS